MNECTYKNYDELPLMLNVVQVAAVLGISAPERMNWSTVRASCTEDRQPHRGAEGQTAGVDRRQHNTKMTTL